MHQTILFIPCYFLLYPSPLLSQTNLPSIITPVSCPFLLFMFYNAPASFNNCGSSSFRACKSEFPPICCLLMKMLGTERCEVSSSRASWMAGPSSAHTHKQTNISALLYSSRGFFIACWCGGLCTHRSDPTPTRSTARPTRSASPWWLCSRGSRIWRTPLDKQNCQKRTRYSSRGLWAYDSPTGFSLIMF